MAWSRFRQTDLPSYNARAEAARARAEAAEAFFRGEASLAEAFPELREAPLGSLPWIATRLGRLDDRETERLQERLAPIPPLGSAARAKQAEAAKAAALAAEQDADGLERRLLLAQRRFLKDHPALTDAGLAATYARLNGAVTRAEVAWAAAAEADRPPLAEAVIRAQDDVRRLDALRADLLRSITVPGAPGLDPAPDVALAQSPLTAEAALERLALMKPLLDDAGRAAVEGAEVAWLLGPPLAEAQEALKAAQAARDAEVAAREDAGWVPPPLAQLKEQADAAQEAATAAEAALTALPSADQGAEAAARRRIASIRQEIARLRADEAAEALTAAEERAQEAAVTSAEADRSKAQAQAAREAAVKAAQDAEDARQLWFAELRRDVANEQEQASALWTEVETTRQETQARLDALTKQLDDLSARAAAAAPLGPLDPRRSEEFDSVFEAGRQVVHDLRSMATELGSIQVSTQVAEGAGGPKAVGSEIRDIPEDLSAEERAALDELGKAREDQRRAQESRIQIARELQDRTLQTLGRAKDLRRDITEDVSDEILADERAYLLEDLVTEIHFITPNLLALIDGRLKAIAAAPKLLTNVDAMVAFLVGSLRLLVVLSVWLWARRRSARLARLLLRSLWRKKGVFTEQNISALVAPLARVVQAGMDLGAGWALVGPITRRIPELGLLLLIYLQVALYRLLVGFFDLLVAKHPEARPNLITLQPEPHQMLRRTVKIMFFWVISRQFVLYITLTILGADRISAMVQVLFSLALAALVLLIFHSWEPVFRTAVGFLDQSNKLVEILSRPPQSTLLKAPRAIASAVLLLTVALINIARGRVDEHSAIGRLVNFVNRYRMAESSEEAAVELPDPPAPLVAVIREKACQDPWFVERPLADKELDGIFTSWREEGRRGLVALLGDQGEGKRTYLDHFTARYKDQGFNVVRARLDRRLTTEGALVSWLADAMGLPNQRRTPAELSDDLNRLPPGLCVVEDLHLAFLRTVDGFEALRTLLYVLNGASRKHFWIVSFHNPAWHYLARLGQLVNMQMFRAAVRLTPMGEQQLRKLVLSRTEGAGYTADFSALVRRSPLGADPQAELERTISAYFRLLGQASNGNPEVALRMWASCLSTTEDPQVVRVRMGEILSEEPVGALSDADLFTLTALRIQDRLTEAELVQVTNMSPGVVRSVIRDLESRNLLRADNGHVILEDAWIPAVTRLLRRRHFMQAQ